MRKYMVLVIALMMMTAIFAVAAVAGGDQNVYGPGEDQPGTGVDLGPGESEAPDSPGVRLGIPL